MWGWLSDEIAFASRSKRMRSFASWANSAGKILMATLRSSRVSRARYTSPIPPAPMGATISYGPSRLPEARFTGAGQEYNVSASVPAGTTLKRLQIVEKAGDHVELRCRRHFLRPDADETRTIARETIDLQIILKEN